MRSNIEPGLEPTWLGGGGCLGEYQISDYAQHNQGQQAQSDVLPFERNARSLAIVASFSSHNSSLIVCDLLIDPYSISLDHINWARARRLCPF